MTDATGKSPTHKTKAISPSIPLLVYALHRENRNSCAQGSQLPVKKAETASILSHFSTLTFKTVKSGQTPTLTVLTRFNVT